MLAYEIQGKKRKREWWKVLVVITGIIVGCGYLLNEVRGEKTGAGFMQVFGMQTNCKKISASSWDCTDELTKEKASKVGHWYTYAETITATITAYSSEEEPGVNASGHEPTLGRSVACPRRLPLGTRVVIRNQMRVCDDRTAKKYDGRFDLYVRDRRDAFAWGKRVEEITIYERD